jgi:hypothetical protein
LVTVRILWVLQEPVPVRILLVCCLPEAAAFAGVCHSCCRTGSSPDYLYHKFHISKKAPDFERVHVFLRGNDVTENNPGKCIPLTLPVWF